LSTFLKEKIAFAVALLAALFTLTPILPDIGSTGFTLLGFTITVRLLYYVLSALLALAVYCYGVQFAFERPRRVLTVTGDVLYAVALVTPVAFLFLFAGTELAAGFGKILRSQTATALTSAVAGALSAWFSTYLVFRTRRALAAKQRELEQRTFANQSILQLRRAEQLEHSGHYDLAIVEAFRAVESAARQSAVVRGQPFPSRWFDAIAPQLPTKDLQQDFEHFRRLRNMAAHAVEPVTADQARKALQVAARLLSFLSGEAA
jgi:hypothetical protein